MSWYSYDDGLEEKARLQREIERRKQRGEVFTPLIPSPSGKKLAHTFWGHAWCRHLEKHSDYSNRLPRGRSYLRQGSVYNVEIEPGLVMAEVAGKHLYEVRISVEPLRKAAWDEFKEGCAGQVSSLLDLLGGKLGDGVLCAITDPDRGLFPRSKEFRFSCSCPDWADMCKHVAAVLYGVGTKLDGNPELFFVLRSVDPAELLGSSSRKALGVVTGVDEALAGEDLSTLFGIELSPDEGNVGSSAENPGSVGGSAPATKERVPRRGKARNKTAKKPRS